MANIIQIMPSTQNRSIVTYTGEQASDRYDVEGWALIEHAAGPSGQWPGSSSTVTPLVFDPEAQGLVTPDQLLRERGGDRWEWYVRGNGAASF